MRIAYVEGVGVRVPLGIVVHGVLKYILVGDRQTQEGGKSQCSERERCPWE